MYFYGDILRFSPKADIPDAMNYGTAVHNSCEYMVKEALKNNKYPSKEDFLNKFREEAKAIAFSTKPIRDMYEERGINELTKFYHHLTDIPISSLIDAEYKIKGVFDDIRFSGKIDRIDKSEDGTYIISDYKTGNPKTEKEITPGGEHEDYYNQICLYKYFFEKESGNKVGAVQFIFPIDGESTLRFYPTDDECREVVENFRAAIKNIEACEFEPNPCEKNCKYCAFEPFCKTNVI
jgi:CRISPR/Cas system-associated exonuclease Cas4 (RecB family)